MNEQKAAYILIALIMLGLLSIFAAMMLTAQPKQYPDIVREANQLKIGQK